MTPNSFGVEGCLDYREFRGLLTRVDEILHLSGVEKEYVRASVEEWSRNVPARYLSNPGTIAHQQEQASRALRCTILKVLLGED